MTVLHIWTQSSSWNQEVEHAEANWGQEVIVVWSIQSDVPRLQDGDESAVKNELCFQKVQNVPTAVGVRSGRRTWQHFRFFSDFLSKR